MKTIGILGGMGPVATAELYKKIIEYCQKKYKAVQDTDYPPVVMYSLPLKGTDETGIVDEELVFHEFIDEIKRLEAHGASFVIMPCNTLHKFDEKIRAKMSIPFLGIVEETCKEVKNSKFRKIALLASETTYKSRTYDNYLDGLIIPNEDERKQISQIILNVMGGRNGLKDTRILLKIINRLKVDAVILGCTELPLVLKQSNCSIKVFDSLEILAKSAVERAKKK